jgi:para-aminobenzoate synthetase component 1
MSLGRHGSGELADAVGGGVNRKEVGYEHGVKTASPTERSAGDAATKLRPMASNSGVLFLPNTMETRLTSEPIFYLRFPREDADALLAVGAEDSFVLQPEEVVDWRALSRWINDKRDWVVGWVGYDGRRAVEQFDDGLFKRGHMPVVCLIKPKHVVSISAGEYRMMKGTWNEAWKEWLNLNECSDSIDQRVEWHQGVSKEDYRMHAQDLLYQIQQGNIYEANYCIDFFANARLNDPAAVWRRLYKKTNAPFAAYAEVDGQHLLCASPERYLKRTGHRVISQPIKGTARRSQDPAEDEQLKQQLASSRKEQAENVMIVDLVRNDLSRCALRGSVKVDELFGVHTFTTVHHLISTISCEVDAACDWTALMQASFPMGSMTGAPKLSAMQWIERHERLSRGIYSGTLGYIDPSGDFDFNVVIRSIQYDAARQLLQCHVGGAITALSDLEEEYKECLLKASAVLDILR